jgi:hypothetical protein
MLKNKRKHKYNVKRNHICKIIFEGIPLNSLYENE